MNDLLEVRDLRSARSPEEGAQSAGEQLLSLSATRHILEDPHTRIVRRAIDANWLYEARNSKTSAGWNPFRGEIYIADNSVVGQWLDDPAIDLRVLNENDLFLPEFAFLLHDYLHVFGARTIAELRPELEFGHGELDPARLEEHAFVLVVTEAVATVGLDYWDLCCRNLGRELDIGSAFARLTVSYQTSLEPEYRRYCEDFTAQTPDFFGLIARFYCTGAFPGFDGEALRRSPVTLGWLRHELLYGGSQRRYSRQWLNHLAGIQPDQLGALDAPIEIPDWGEAVIKELGARLWAKVKQGDACTPAAHWDPERAWRAPQRGPIDFRFTNLAGFEDLDVEIERRGVLETSRAQWREQLLRSRRYPIGDRDAIAAVSALAHSQDHAVVAWAAKQLPAYVGAKRSEHEPLDMFFLK
ncbi:hypothetical protein DB30_02677 [Enhygromyxa salina]|uniref:Uncharacterized protein n=1 Tax=Enhygromyxa salina TaxID=215803 RepID=A0A0C2D8F9_9BACT|nr:hypothetical protein [Enhygromyxa salina]KIG19396.1 hypothetical protein DB30_02677 [Enhygromyxa salina]